MTFFERERGKTTTTTKRIAWLGRITFRKRHFFVKAEQGSAIPVDDVKQSKKTQIYVRPSTLLFRVYVKK